MEPPDRPQGAVHQIYWVPSAVSGYFVSRGRVSINTGVNNFENFELSSENDKLDINRKIFSSFSIPYLQNFIY